MSSDAALSFVILSIGCLASPRAVRAKSNSYADIVAKVLPSVVNISIQGAGERVKIGGDAGRAGYATYFVEYIDAGSITDPSGIS